MSETVWARPVSTVELGTWPVPRTDRLRRWAAGQLGEIGEDHLRAVQLVLTELVSNAHRHGGGGRFLRLRHEPRPCLVRVEVEDNATGRPAGDGPGGRGLALVAAVVRRWGVAPAPAGGKRVWADVDCGTFPWRSCPDGR